MFLDEKFMEFVQQYPGRKLVFLTDNDENLGYCKTYHDISSYELAEIILFRETIYDEEDDFVAAYVDYFWRQDSELSEDEQREQLEEEAKQKWDIYREEVVLVRTDWWSPREV